MCPLFVQFSVHFLFFTCLFFYYKKILHLFHLLFLTLLARTCFFVFVLCRAIPAPGDAAESVLPGTARCDQRKRGRPLPGPGKPEPLRTHTGRWGFVGLRVFVIVFVWVCEFFLFECRLFSLHLYTYVTFL